ncbi:unnamed protein product, partial [Iphiclides podalirius]
MQCGFHPSSLRPSVPRAPSHHDTHAAFVQTYVVWICLVLAAGARARSAPPAPAGCQWDYSDTKLSESNFLTCNIKTIGSADFLFKNITTAQAYNINKLKLTCTDLLFFESSLHMNTGSFLGQLRKLEDLRIEYCKIRYVPATVLSPLRDLTSLTLRSFNTDWPAMTMEFHAESFRGLMELRSLDLDNEKNVQQNIRMLDVSYNALEDIDERSVPDSIENYLKTCHVLLWGEKKFWEKIRFVMPDISNLQWNKDNLNYNHGVCPNARRHPSRYTASPTAPELWYKYDAIPAQTQTNVNIGVNVEDDTSMLTNTTLTSQVQDGDNPHHSYISIDAQNYEQPYGGRPRPPNSLRKHPGHSSPSMLDDQGYLQPRSSVHECLPQTHSAAHR